MILAEVNDGKCSLAVKGTISAIEADLCVLIRSMHNSLIEESQSEHCAEMFKSFIQNELPKLVFKSSDEICDMLIEKLKAGLRRADD